MFKMKKVTIEEIQSDPNFHTHKFSPFLPRDAQILILGSFPSPSSREKDFYYMDHRNRFYTILNYVLQENCGDEVDDRKELLRKHKIALYDVVEACIIPDARDSSIKKPILVDLQELLKKLPHIKQIFVLGLTTTKKLFNKIPSSPDYSEPIEYDKITTFLPSTSSANRRFSTEELKEKFKTELTKYIS